MPSRFRASIRPWVYNYLCMRDGERCAICGKVPTCPKSKKGMSKYLDVDHVNGNKKDNDPGNLRLLCRSCNVAESNRSRARRTKGSLCVCVSATEALKSVVSYSDGSAEMAVSGYCETKFRAWVMTVVEEEGFIRKSDAVEGGAELVGCSTATTLRYLTKMASITGALKIEKDATGKVVYVKR